MKKVMLCTLILMCLITSCFSQNEKKKEYKIHTIAFYNLENLFDTIDNSITKDQYSPILKMKGNKTKAYWNKINNMARVLSEIGKEKSGKSPSVIGIAEIENTIIFMLTLQIGEELMLHCYIEQTLSALLIIRLMN
jgi:hypothetical protein